MTRVLLVDDNEPNLYYLSALLRAHGYETESARHGAEALVKARRSPPDLVVSDLLMPVMDGYTLLRQWTADPHLRGVPFVVYTATYTEPEDEDLARGLGARAFILKPAEPEAFIARLRAVQSEAAPAPSALPTPPPENGLFAEYSEVLIRKLEQKTLQLEETNRALHTDVAAREATEAALRASEANLRLLTEAMPQLVWVSRADGKNVFTNQRWGEYTGLAASASEGDRWIDPFHPDDRARVSAAWAEAIATGGTYSLEARIRRHDGAYRWWLVRGVPQRDGSGAITKWLGTCTDIDDIKRTAADLEQAHSQLRQAQKMEAIGRLAGGVAHDFNNLLSVILSYTTLVLDEMAPDAPMREELGEVRRAGERASDLTRQLLAFSRQQMLQPRVLDLGKVLRDMEKMLRSLLGEDVDLALATEGLAGKVHVDPSQIEQIVMNLSINARDAMPRGGKLTIEATDVELDQSYVALHPGAAAGWYVMLAATDCGAGMDAATRERIFEPFFTTKEKGKGTGLGLSTVFGIVEQSHGHIEVYSEPGVGTCFKIYLPRTDRQAAEPEHLSLPVAAALRGSETVLVVEDDSQVRAMTCAILRRSGYRVMEAGDGDAALALSGSFEGEIHLLLTDVVMPRMSGREVAEHIAATRARIKVLYVSGYTDKSIVHHGILDDGIAFLQKPITPDALLRRIREVLTAP